MSHEDYFEGDEMELRDIYTKHELPALLLKQACDRWTKIMNQLDPRGNELDKEIWLALQSARSEALDLYEEHKYKAEQLRKALQLGIYLVKK